MQVCTSSGQLNWEGCYINVSTLFIMSFSQSHWELLEMLQLWSLGSETLAVSEHKYLAVFFSFLNMNFTVLLCVAENVFSSVCSQIYTD